MLLTANTLSAQSFVDLTSSQMKIDTLLPEMSHFFALPKGYKDSTYNVQLKYPEYTRMSRKDRRRYRKLAGRKSAPSVPDIEYATYSDRKNGMLSATFVPVVEHNGKLSFISSYKPVLVSEAKPAPSAAKGSGSNMMVTDENSDTYTSRSVLAKGSWAKIMVSETGIHKLTADVIRRAGFSNLSKVKIYGYGGALVPECLTQEYLKETDDLKEVPTCTVGGEKYFFAQGPVSWSSKTAQRRTRNHYADYGCYFITEGNSPATCTEEDLKQMVLESNNSYHSLYEVDKFAWAESGRNLFDNKKIESGKPQTVEILIPAGNTSAEIQVAVSSGMTATFTVTCGTQQKSGSMSVSGQYAKCAVNTQFFSVSDLESYPKDENGATLYPVTISCNTSGAVLRLDYVSASFNVPQTPASLESGSYPSARYVYNITNQNHHADTPTDLIIIIPTTQKLLAQAQELAKHHLEHDGISTRIVPADELYNEFSSGTPDFSAYKRYLKMFYDRAEDEASMPKNVLLLGDAVWDNRMNTLPSTKYNPDNYLLCYQTENSYTYTASYTSDDFITVLEDDKSIHGDVSTLQRADHFDIGVGRIPVSDASEAKIVVDKIKHYTSSQNVAGSWQNELMFIGDDGDSNSHMINVDSSADLVINNHPGYYVKKVLSDAYERKATSTGNRYPEVTEMIRKQMKNGALVMNYGGHASWTLLADEQFLVLNDIKTHRSDYLPFWYASACETSPFDQTVENLGKASLLNPNGGAIAFYGASRAVSESYNGMLSRAFMRYLLSYDSNGKPLTLGEVQRLAKNSLITNINKDGKDITSNKHQYNLLGDPAMSLAIPQFKAVVDKINDVTTDKVETVEGNSIVSVEGHITNLKGEESNSFTGTANILVRDSRRMFTCRDNVGDGEKLAYYDRNSILFKGVCDVKDGKFSFTFKMPSDIYNDGNNALITVYASDRNSGLSANGECGSLRAQGWKEYENDFVGPSIYAYLNTPSFQNGGDVSTTPFFVAEVSDEDGVNATGASLGHNMELVIDGDTKNTYVLDNNFVFDNGSYTSGQTYYVLPALTPGTHTLSFKAWDLLGNSNTASLSFRVVKNMLPEISKVAVYPNPVRESATFYVTHDMRGSQAQVFIDIIDLSGRIVETLEWSDTLSETSDTTSFRWTPGELSSGIYLYRVRISGNGNDYVSKSQKLILAQ